MNTVDDAEVANLITTEFAAQFNLSLDDYRKLAMVCTTMELTTVLELLKAKSHTRSKYRYRMSLQVRGWLTNPQYKRKPLSQNQFDALRPTWPLRWKFPTYY